MVLSEFQPAHFIFLMIAKHELCKIVHFWKTIIWSWLSLKPSWMNIYFDWPWIYSYYSPSVLCIWWIWNFQVIPVSFLRHSINYIEDQELTLVLLSIDTDLNYLLSRVMDKYSGNAWTDLVWRGGIMFYRMIRISNMNLQIPRSIEGRLNKKDMRGLIKQIFNWNCRRPFMYIYKLIRHDRT